MVTSTGLEPVTSRLGILRSIQMSYEATRHNIDKYQLSKISYFVFIKIIMAYNLEF